MKRLVMTLTGSIFLAMVLLVGSMFAGNIIAASGPAAHVVTPATLATWQQDRRAQRRRRHHRHIQHKVKKYVKMHHRRGRHNRRG